MTKDEFEDAKTLWKMIYAYHCFRNVENACSFILDQKMDENHPAYYSLITGICVLYGKPFKHSNAVGKLSGDIAPQERRELHKLLLDHRDQVYAHTDPKSFELPNFGEANQVRFVVSPGASADEIEIHNFATQFKARPPLLPGIVDLCHALQEKANYHIRKLQERHLRKIPMSPGEYNINVLDESGPFVKKEKSLISPF
jgi:hypothetical protein